MGTTSELSEKIKPELLDESEIFTIDIVDGVSQQKLHTYHEEVPLNKPFTLDLTKFIPREEVLTLERFIDVASNVITDAQNREGIVLNEQVKLVQEYQPEEFYKLGDEIISFKVIKREPGKMNRKATGMVQRGYSHSYEGREHHNPDKIITVESRSVDHQLELSVWAKTATLANRRALWLERLFVNNRWAFEVQGAERFFWEGRGPDTVWKHAEQRIHQRPLRFFLRSKELRVRAHSRIVQFNLDLQIII